MLHAQAPWTSSTQSTPPWLKLEVEHCTVVYESPIFLSWCYSYQTKVTWLFLTIIIWAQLMGGGGKSRVSVNDIKREQSNLWMIPKLWTGERIQVELLMALQFFASDELYIFTTAHSTNYCYQELCSTSVASHRTSFEFTAIYYNIAVGVVGGWNGQLPPSTVFS